MTTLQAQALALLLQLSQAEVDSLAQFNTSNERRKIAIRKRIVCASFVYTCLDFDRCIFILASNSSVAFL